MELKKRLFLKAIDQSQGTILSLCKVYFGDTEDQKDAFQDVVLQLWKSFDSFRGDSELNTWVYSVSINTILTKIRKSKKSVNSELLGEDISIAINSFVDDNLELLSMIIQQLKEEDKAIVVLYLEGYKNKEIAKMLSMSQSNVGTRLNRIKSQLKSKYNQKADAVKGS